MSDIVGQLVLGWLLADLLTGAFHWWEDRFGNENWPLIGPWIIAPNQLHHIEPLAFAQNGFWGRNRASIFATGAFGVVWLAAFGPSIMLFATLFGGAIANEVHYFAHCPKEANAVVRVLQQTGLLQSPKSHSTHHRPPHLTNFCVLTDWLNPPLEALGFWRGLEHIFRRKAAP